MLVFILLSLVGSLAQAAPSDPVIRAIDQEVLAIDRKVSSMMWTSKENCVGNVCNTTISYWDEKGRLRKTVEEIGASAETGSVRARFFSEDCRLILTRQAPRDSRAAKDPKKLEKYYFRKGKLVRIVFGDKVKTFDK